MPQKPKKPAAGMPTNAAKEMRDKFWTADSTNLANAYKKQIDNVRKYSSFPSELAAHNYFKNETPAAKQKRSNSYSSANDSISAIEARRAGDSTFTDAKNKIVKRYNKLYEKYK